MAKRANGEGRFYHIVPINCDECCDKEDCPKRGNQTARCERRDRVERWCYQYTIKTAGTKIKRKKIYAKTKKQLLTKIEKMKAESGDTYKYDVTLGGWLDVWVTKCIPNTVQATTETHYKSMLKHVPDLLRTKQLSKITPMMLQGFLSDILDHGRKKDGGPLSVKTVRSVRTTLGAALEAAVDQGYIIKNPIKKTKPPVWQETKEIVYLNDDEVHRLLEVADSGAYYEASTQQLAVSIDTPYLFSSYAMAIRLTLATGMRWAECFGLCWDDVSFTDNTIFIHNNLINGKLKKTKTKYSVRRIAVDVDTMKLLKEYRTKQRQYIQRVGDQYLDDMGLLFSNSRGKAINYDNFRCRYFNKMKKCAALPEKCTFHSLRHTHATTLFKLGKNVKAISQRLGHSSVAFTLKTYIHVIPGMDQDLASAMGDVLKGKTEK